MARNRKPPELKRTEVTYVRFSVTLKRQLEVLAGANGITLGTLIDTICNEFVRSRAEVLNKMTELGATVQIGSDKKDA